MSTNCHILQESASAKATRQQCVKTASITLTHQSTSSSPTIITNLSASQWCGAAFGGKALELVGRVVHPKYQRRGIATIMLEDLVQSEQPEFLSTYTRNPSIVRMIQHVSSELYPVQHDDILQDLASEMPFAEARENIFYHINRYDDYEEGLFVGSDPADSPLKQNGLSLKQQYRALTDARNALIITARVRR